MDFNFGYISAVMQVGKQTAISVTTPAGGSSEVSFQPDDGRNTVIAYGISSKNLAAGQAFVSIFSPNHFNFADWLTEDHQSIVCLAHAGDKATVTVVNQAATELDWNLLLLELNTEEARQFFRMMGVQ